MPERDASTSKGPPPVIALDGEGYTTKSGRHLYTYVAAATRDELISDLYAPRGIKTRALFEWLLSLPGAPYRLVGFSLGYDRTKWLEDMPEHALYALLHPEERPGEYGPVAISCGGYRINLVSSKFTIGRLGREGKTKKTGRTVWDVFRFYQTSFVKALEKWKVGTPEEIARIDKMKKKRGSFRAITARERAYCQSECKLLARLVEELLAAHEAEELPLDRAMFGPGTTAGKVLDKCHAKDQVPSVDGQTWVQCAYFGGRFECSHVGPVKGPLYAYDIASAYPYSLALLPCLHQEHGRWRHVEGGEALSQALASDVACVRYRTVYAPGMAQAWGPLPHRVGGQVNGQEFSRGSILFPVKSAGGWAWSVELRPAMRLHPGVTPLEAWVWERKCDCPPPFREEIVRLFVRRLTLGKGSRGIVLKLAMNSMYGKSAQHVGGGGRYRSMVRAGLVTARTRGMLLEAVLLAKSKWNILELATDSVLSREPLALPAPIPLGTGEAAALAKECELGAWENKQWQGGVFLLRPGLRFPTGDGAEDVASVAARGVGIATLHENARRVLRAWKKEPMAPVYVQQPAMFHGAKSSIRKVMGKPGPTGDASWDYVRDDSYGKWERPTRRILSYEPMPKRSGVLESCEPRGSALSLAPWELPDTPEAVSVPYGDPEVEDLERLQRSEQPDGGEMLACFPSEDF